MIIFKELKRKNHKQKKIFVIMPKKHKKKKINNINKNKN